MGAQPCPVWEQGKRQLCQTQSWFHRHDPSPMWESISRWVGNATPLDEIPFPKLEEDARRAKHVPVARTLARHQQNHFAARRTKTPAFSPPKFKAPPHPVPAASPGAGAADSAPALLSHRSHLSPDANRLRR